MNPFDLMDAQIVDESDGREGTRYVTIFDAIPGFWSYLVGLNRDDLIAELIQNDLDQGATRTVISFERTCLICEGDGEPVDPEGWQRLQMILGAGDKVPAKRSKFGVKNHGLKTAFKIGDEICLMSAGQSIVQTLYASGRNMPPHPGASEHPMEDPQAPIKGCRVIVQYRGTDLETTQGESFKLYAVSLDEIEELFRSACASIPEQFAGIVSPEVTPRYEIVLRHWKLGEARFRFSCTRPNKAAKRIEVFQRRCAVNGTYSPLPNPLRERAARRLVPLTGVLKDRVAKFFRRGRRFFIEVSWPIDAKGKPRTGTGRYRYPIGYPANSREARTGHGTYFNAPFLSDNKRHFPVRNEVTNTELREACESLLIDTLAHHVIPRWKADGLNPIVPSDETDDGNEVVRALLAVLVTKRALPVLNWRQAAELATKSKKESLKAVARHPVSRRSTKSGRRYCFVVPTLTWAESRIEPLLSLICPPSEIQLDSRVHPKIISLLADRETPGFYEKFVTFDENDVIDRVTSQGNNFFGAVADPEYEFSQAFIARAYLDLIELALNQGGVDTEKEDALISTLLLPDEDGQATSFSDLYSNASLPSNIPGLHLPPILDTDLVSHALFKRKKWKPRKFTMVDFLESATLETADERIRRMFWKWLSKNDRYISTRDRPKLAELVIWPDENNSLCRISDLCEPRSSRVGNVLAGFIRRPHREVRRSKLVSIRGRARTSVRRKPTEEEVGTWLSTQLTRFEIGSLPDAATVNELHRFKVSLSILLKDRSIALLLKTITSTLPALPALARDGTIRWHTELVFPSGSNNRLALPDRYLPRDRQYATLLAKLSPALNVPTAAMLLDAFDEDSGNFTALQPRLKEFMSIAESDDDERRELAGKSIIPLGRKTRMPCELVFISNKGDYWGSWKIRISSEGLSQNDQSRYRFAGVTPALPRPETSREFFRWLATQNQDVLGRNISCVLRHFLDPNGPVRWARNFTDTPCIPAKGRDGLCLVPFKFTLRNPVFLSDSGDIGDDVIQNDSTVLLAIHKAKEVKTPIFEQLRELGLKSLREELKDPERVTGLGNIVPVSKEILTRFNRLRSPGFRRTFEKRLTELGVELKLVRRDWQHRLERVQEIRFGEEVEICYRFRRKPYLQKADAGFDPSTGIFWVKQGLGLHRLYESVAKQLIFKPTAQPIVLLSLEHAVEMEITDPSFGRPVGSQADVDEDTAAEDSDEQRQDGEAKSGLGEAGNGHSPFEPDPARNRPKPGPISTESAGRPRRPKGQPGSPGSGGGGSSRKTPDLERTQIEELKRSHYASHCQICLCEHSPQELAPAGSYIEAEEVRQCIVQAHHTDLVSAGGARHAGNIILLCKLHHDNYGRQFSRAGISTALRNSPKEISIRYDKDTYVDGRQIELVISDTGKVVKLFFTEHHFKFWLKETASD